MVNKDYILRLAEKFGRTLAIILHLREYNQYEEALIYIDDLFLQAVGLTSSFINSVSDDMLLQAISPLGVLNVDKCLWIAALLKAEGSVYEDQAKTTESYYRYLKSLHMFLTALSHEVAIQESDFYLETEELFNKLEEYELPLQIKSKLFSYYEQVGRYDKAENILFEIIEGDGVAKEQFDRGRAFYTRLAKKNDADLLAGNLSREEVEEGRAQLEDHIL